MDNIYDNLENYDDVNVDELIKENTELKLKLQERSAAMEILQKEYDELASELKKLETNYSSLLKTARQEIERKTQIINKFNIEKDLNVLFAIQNKNTPNFRRNTFTSKPKIEDASKKEVSKDKPVEKLADNVNNMKTVANERKSENRMSSVTNDTVTNISKNGKNVDSWKDNKNNNAKENISQPHKLQKDAVITKASSIKNRRKSMPAIWADGTYSSDEECDKSNKKTISSRNDNSKRRTDRNQDDRYRIPHLDERYKTSETSSMEGSHFSHRGSNTYQSRSSRYHNNNKYRSNKDNRDSYHSSKRNHSPERSQRFGRCHPDDLFSRHAYRRYRVLESPPPDGGSQYSSWNTNTQHKYDRVDYQFEMNTDHYQDKYTTKHKLYNDDGPDTKRQRTDSGSGQLEDDKKWERERNILHNPILDSLDMHQSSCQSPDYTVPDTTSTQPKEIMSTAVIKLDDPRVKSKKYVLHTVDDQVTLSTVTGRNVDLKVLDTSKWDIKRIELPKALKRRPSQCSDEIISEIYMDVDNPTNPIPNISIESGEILYDIEDATPTAIPNVERTKKVDKCETKTAVDIPIYNRDSIDKLAVAHSSKDSKSNYRIPKIKQQDTKLQSQDSNPLVNKQSDKVNLHPLGEGPTRLGHKSELHDKIQDKNDKQHSLPTNKDSNHLHLCKEIVAGDLELSDETSDYIVTSNKLTTNERKTPDDTCQNMIYDIKTDIKINKDDLGKHGKEKEKICLIISKKSIENSPSTKVNNGPEENKKSKVKKRSQRSNLSNPIKEGTDQTADKKTKTRKEKKEPGEIKTKFTDLFGDSNSLITPEDLGIVAGVSAKLPPPQDLPVCEDAQDAVDIKDEEKMQTRLSKLKTADTVPDQFDHTTKITNKPETKAKSKARKANTDSKRKNVKKHEPETLVGADDNACTLESASYKDEVKDTCKNLPVIESVIDNNSNKEPEYNDNMETARTQNVALTFKPDLLKALATSTPQKEFTPHNPEIDLTTNIIETVNSKLENDEVTITDNNSTKMDQSYNNDTLDSHNDADVPDVRIFVKRKRKVIKKAK